MMANSLNVVYVMRTGGDRNSTYLVHQKMTRTQFYSAQWSRKAMDYFIFHYIIVVSGSL